MKKFILFTLLVIIAIGSQSFSSTAPQASLKKGQAVYETYCISCHMEDGNGVPSAFPSLVKTGNLTDKNRLVKIVLQGVRGPIVVKGEKYDAEMASITITDQEVADVINYIRNTWGNKAPLMNVSEVALAKKAVVKGYQAY
jgi:mono/diheme cytochrome c family protein